MTIFALDAPHALRYEYFQLPEAARPAARRAVLAEECQALRRRIAETRAAATRNIHRLVNDPHHVAILLAHRRLVRALGDVPRLERFIDGNVCHFLEDGTYVLYRKPQRDPSCTSTTSAP